MHRQKKTESSKVTKKAVLIGLILIPLNAYWIGLGSELWYSLHITSASLFFNTVFSLFCVILLNFILKKFLRKFALSSNELLTIYVMLVMLSTVCGHTMMMYLVGILAHPFWFATVENEWADLFWKFIPEWFTVSDKDVLRDYFLGDSTLYTVEHLSAWLTPVLVWTSIIFVLFFIFILLNVILRKQWIERDKLSYPIVQLPLEMTSPGFFKSRLMWIGFAASASIDILNGLHSFFPNVPYIHVKLHEVGHYFTEKPFSAIGWTQISFYPFIIGLTFFVPLDLSFSVWFFYLFGKAERIFGSIVGTQSMPSFPYFNEQAAGAWIGLGILALWGSRSHLLQVIKKIAHREANFEDSNEPISYRTAAFGITVGTIFLVFLLKKAGMGLWVILLYFAIYFAMSIGITRARAAIGPPVHEVIWIHPQGMMVDTFGTRKVGGANLTILSFLYAFNRCNRAHPMPNQLEALKIAEQKGMENKKLLKVLILSLAVSIIVSFWIYLDIMYKYGAAARCRGYIVGIGWESFNRLASWLNYPRDVNTSAISFMGIGLAFTFFITLMRQRFIWWPFHPAGYALGATAGGGVGYFWFPVLISWAIKTVILKHGGLKQYRKAVPFFLGLILGEYIVGCFWSLFGVIFQVRVYSVWLF